MSPPEAMFGSKDTILQMENNVQLSFCASLCYTATEGKRWQIMESMDEKAVQQCQNCWYFCPEHGQEYGCRNLRGLLSATEMDSCECWANRNEED